MNVDRDVFFPSVRVRPRKFHYPWQGSEFVAVIQYALILAALFVAVLTIVHG
jgi:hypothetical protein